MSAPRTGSKHKLWLNKATEDLAVAQLLEQHNHMGHACFSAQQCMEKSLKGFLLANNLFHRRTHRLIELLVQCRKVDAAFAAFEVDCLVVDQYYIPTRYPDSAPPGSVTDSPGPNEAAEAVAAAEKLFAFVQARLPG